MRQPYLTNWRNETNNHEFATYRILLRSLFSGVRGATFQPQSQELGRFLIHALLSLIENLAGSTADAGAGGELQQVARAADGDQVKHKTLRGVYGHLLALMASGAKAPLSKLYSVIYPKPLEFPMPESDADWACLARFRAGFAATGWDVRPVDSNIRRVLVRALRRGVDPLTQPLRDNLNRMRVQQGKQHLERRNAELEWFALLANVVSRAKQAAAANCPALREVAAARLGAEESAEKRC